MPQALRELSCNQRHDVIRHLHQFIKGGWLTHGAFAKTARELDVSARVVSAIWRTFRGSGKIESNKAGNVGRPKRYTVQDIQQRVGAVPFEQRSTMRDISVATGIPVGTLSRHLKKGTFRRRSTRIKPLLSDANKQERVQFCRWFNADKDRRTMYLLANEAPPCRSWKSKRFIPKVMFLAAVARPRFDEGRGVLFDGKIGMWPFVDLVPAVRSSRNRPAGTLVTTLVNVNANVYRDSNMHDIVHVDEKWFYLTRVKKKFYVYDDEEVAARSVKSKNFITKVIFLAAVARPRYDPAIKKDFDGKIGIWPFVEIVAAKRKRINREKRTPVTVPQNVNGGVYKEFMLQKVVPAVLARFPVGELRRGVRI
ncbi:hypothetical protein H257_11084 [Aphanomyces astaci]|uniref:Transposase Tc1-like domain-containing protein n=1 Tax=Aphanomyces astaci TaxID=112090 RepID=W4G525_APHAT|nr:hypothetical protein H257_11084 [Aphanomyces astaci]ETV74119.1 hypothetical protein H257_11084 [Aphanomyces astaci]|eukprot:XP_009836225.1 hypothetical protein H257_11084 [Aphanomyces astaci]